MIGCIELQLNNIKGEALRIRLLAGTATEFASGCDTYIHRNAPHDQVQLHLTAELELLAFDSAGCGYDQVLVGFAKIALGHAKQQSNYLKSAHLILLNSAYTSPYI